MKGGPAVAVDIDGDVLVWHDGRLMGNQEMKDAAQRASFFGGKVSLIYGIPESTANLETDEDGNYDYVGIASALVSANPGRAILIEFPDEVEHYLEKWNVEALEGVEVVY